MIAQFHQAGIDASANAIPIDQALAYQKKPDKAPWDILVFSGIPDSAHPGSAATLFYGTGGGINWNGYSNPKVDKLFAEADAETDVPKRDALYLQGAKVAFDDFAFVPIAEVYDVQVFHGKYCDTNSTPAVPWQVDLGTVRPC
jgi:ABC-type transport system substrate-binding protein